MFRRKGEEPSSWSGAKAPRFILLSSKEKMFFANKYFNFRVSEVINGSKAYKG